MPNSPWFSSSAARDIRKQRLFCLPHAGGGTAGYHRWTAHLPATLELVAVKLPGREDRFDEVPREDLDELAAEIVEELVPWTDLPFAFFGHSMGAALGYRIAVQLARLHHRLPSVLFVSACRSPLVPRTGEQLHKLDDETMIQRLVGRYGSTRDENMTPTSGAVPSKRGELEMMRLMAKTIRADLKMLETYQHDDAPPLACDMFAMGGADDPQVTRAELQQWAPLTGAKFTIRSFPGHHFYLKGQESAVVKTVTGRLCPPRS